MPRIPNVQRLLHSLSSLASLAGIPWQGLSSPRKDSLPHRPFNSNMCANGWRYTGGSVFTFLFPLNGFVRESEGCGGYGVYGVGVLKKERSASNVSKSASPSLPNWQKTRAHACYKILSSSLQGRLSAMSVPYIWERLTWSIWSCHEQETYNMSCSFAVQPLSLSSRSFSNSRRVVPLTAAPSQVNHPI